ncbi:hypothetical protein [Nostoc sp. CALU 1950]|uniref:hypothetical protein n=1 Tax=Nostoc sp. CALU 1950 TaxID=3104321 RepID=UPI003EB7DA42
MKEELLIVDQSPVPNPQSPVPSSQSPVPSPQAPRNSNIEVIAPESMQHSEVS